MKKSKKKMLAAILSLSVLVGVVVSLRCADPEEDDLGFDPWVPPLGITCMVPQK